MVISPIFIQSSFASDSTKFGKITLYCQNNYYDISYRISNATVSNVTATTNFQLNFDIQNSENGIMIVDAPRNILRESIPNSTDYVPYANDHYLKFTDMSNSTHLIRTFVLPNGNFRLEFDAMGYVETMPQSMNCSVIPEFPFAIPVFVISASLIILISSRLKIKF